MIRSEIDVEERVQISISDEERVGVGANLSGGLPDLAYVPSRHIRPRTLIGPTEIESARRRIRTYEWAAYSYADWKQQADLLLEVKLIVPTEPGGHPSWYLDPNGAGLEYDADSGQHISTIDGSAHTSDKIEAGWRFHRHCSLIEALKTLSVMYALSDHAPYANKARELLLAYSEAYLNYPLHDRGGRLFWQSLDEAVALVELSQSYDYVYGSAVFTEEERARIERDLLLASAITVSRYDMGRSNWQAWHIAGVGLAGYALGDERLIDFAVNGEHGFRYLMEASVLPDGFWWEGTITYHMYALAPLHLLAEGAKRWGHDLYAHPQLKSMFDAPIDYAYPDLSFPVNNDGGRYGSSLLRDASGNGQYEYEAAYGHYRDSRYGRLLQRKVEEAGKPRGGLFALFHGAEELPGEHGSELEPADRSGGCRNFAGIGHAILRSQMPAVLGGGKELSTAERTLYALVDYGPHGGSHGHPDKLHLDLFGCGTPLAPDFGTPSYGHPLYRAWYKQTASHNTVTVDGRSQQQSEGTLHAFADCGPFRIVQASADEAYPGVSYCRTVWLMDDMALDWFEAADDEQERQFDYLLHGIGTCVPSLAYGADIGSLGEQDGFPLMASVKKLEPAESQCSLHWNSLQAGLEATVLIDDRSSLYAAQGPGPSDHPDVLHSVFIHRQIGKSASFVTLLRPVLKDSEIQSPVLLRADKRTVRVERSGQETIYYCAEPEPGQPMGLFAAIVEPLDTGKYGEWEPLEAISWDSSGSGHLQIGFSPPFPIRAAWLLLCGVRGADVRLNGTAASAQHYGEFTLIRV